MAKPPYHPTRDQIDLSTVLDALSDPIRREVVVRLAEMGEANCSSFVDCASKTNLTYHLARLREAGIINVRIDGAQRLITLRTADIETRFPGLFPAILAGTRRERHHDPASGSGPHGSEAKADQPG